MEEWKVIEHPYNNYEISNEGNIRNIKTGYNFLLSNSGIGYIRIALHNKSITKSFLIHQLVAKYFLNDYFDKCVIHHIDGDRYNNKHYNLKCVTILENNKNKIFPVYGKKYRQITQYDKNMILIKIWDKVKNIKNVSKAGIYAALKLKKLYKNYYWKYYEENNDGEKWIELNIDNIKIYVSSDGRIKTLTGKITSGYKNYQGYCGFAFGKKHYSIHRLICMAFKPLNSYENLYVNHIDGNKSNNKIENLEWVSPSQNVKKYYEINNKIKRNIFKRKVIRIDVVGNEIEYESLDIAAKLNNIKNKGNIVLVCQNKRHTAGGFKWQYLILCKNN